MTGSIILGTRDGCNIEIVDEIGEDHIIFFSKNVDEVRKIRENAENMKNSGKNTNYVGSRLRECFDALYNNELDNTSFIHDYIRILENGRYYYMACLRFYDYIKAQERVDKEYLNIRIWTKKCIENICHMCFFSSDRSIRDYSNEIW